MKVTLIFMQFPYNFFQTKSWYRFRILEFWFRNGGDWRFIDRFWFYFQHDSRKWSIFFHLSFYGVHRNGNSTFRSNTRCVVIPNPLSLIIFHMYVFPSSKLNILVCLQKEFSEMAAFSKANFIEWHSLNLFNPHL